MIMALREQQGQAATEFIIASVFILVPLFLIIPLLGKYIDIRHAAIQQARFEAWEYTVWYGSGEKIMTGVKDSQSAGRKSYDQTRQEGISLFFSNPRSRDYGQPGAEYQANPLWFDHRGDSLFANVAVPGTSGDISENQTPDPTVGIFDVVLKLLSWIFQAFGEIMSWVGVHADFDAINTDAYFTTNVDIQVRSLDEILPETSLAQIKRNTTAHPLTIHAKASVLTNNWNAGSRDNATTETRGLVFTALLKPLSDTLNIVSTTLNHIAHYLYYLGFEIQAPGVPDFGYVQDDLIPLEHLNENTKILKEAKIEADKESKSEEIEQGLFYYEEPR